MVSHCRVPSSKVLTLSQNWGGSVKTRLFVMALRDHYRDLAADVKFASDASKRIVGDEWALEYLGSTWLNPIMEAFDDDGSGYVTIAEVNRFMDWKPPELNWR